MCVSVLQEDGLKAVMPISTPQMKHGVLKIKVPGITKDCALHVTRKPTPRYYKRNIGKKFSVVIEEGIGFTIYSSNKRDNSFYEYVIFRKE